MLNLANRLSILRILLIPLFIVAIMYYAPERDYLRILAIVIFALAVLTDALDGYIARVKGERTALGTFLDPLADKLLVITVYICLALAKSSPAQFQLAPWIVITVISRDAIIVLGSAMIYMINGKLNITPTALGKLTTVFQMMTVFALLIGLPIIYLKLIMYTMVGFTVLSGLDYIRIGSRQFNETNQKRNGA